MAGSASLRDSLGLQRPAPPHRQRGEAVGQVVEHLRRSQQTRKRGAALANPGERRGTYAIAVQISPAEKKKLQARARDEVRSVSSYVAKLIVEALGRPTTFA